MMEKERSGLFCRRIRYDGAWETVYFLESGGGLWLPEPLLRARGLFPGRRLAVGPRCGTQINNVIPFFGRCDLSGQHRAFP